MLGHYPNPSPDHEAQLGLVVANLFREEGWKVVKQPRERGAAPDLIASRPGKKLVVEIKRGPLRARDRKSTRLNSSHGYISYAVFCLKKKNRTRQAQPDELHLGAISEVDDYQQSAMH